MCASGGTESSSPTGSCRRSGEPPTPSYTALPTTLAVQYGTASRTDVVLSQPSAPPCRRRRPPSAPRAAPSSAAAAPIGAGPAANTRSAARSGRRRRRRRRGRRPRCARRAPPPPEAELPELPPFVPPILRFVAMVCILYGAYRIRLLAVHTYGRVIHEFDPWFNSPRDGGMSEHGYAKFIKGSTPSPGTARPPRRRRLPADADLGDAAPLAQLGGRGDRPERRVRLHPGLVRLPHLPLHLRPGLRGLPLPERRRQRGG